MCVLGGKVVGCWAKMFCNWPSFMTTVATRINPGKFLLGFRAPFVKNTEVCNHLVSQEPLRLVLIVTHKHVGSKMTHVDTLEHVGDIRPEICKFSYFFINFKKFYLLFLYLKIMSS